MRRFLWGLLFLAAVACAAGLLLGCGTHDSEPAPLRIGYSVRSREAPWQQSYLQAFREELKRHPKLEIEWSIGNSDPAATVSTLERWIAQRMDLIVSSSPDHMPLRMTYRKALAAGIPVILTGDSPDYRLFDSITTYSGFAPWDSGRMAAEVLDQALGGKGSIACITGPRGSASERQQTEGFEAALKRLSSHLDVVATADGRWNTTVAYQKALEILERHPKLAAIYAADDAMGSAVIRALKQKGFAPGQVKVVSQGGSKGSIADLKAGWYFSIIYQDPTLCARQDMWLIRALLENHQQLPSVVQARQGIIGKELADSVTGW